jgi:hypothetical protein
MAQSESIAAIAKALAAAQGEMSAAKKDSNNPHFKSKYADLTAVWDACRAALSRHSVAVVQAPEPSESGVMLRTVLMHESGEWIDSTLFIPAAQSGAQAFGSAMSYARRYSLAAMVGVVADEDDDGNAASGRTSAGSGSGAQQGQPNGRASYNGAQARKPGDDVRAAHAAAVKAGVKVEPLPDGLDAFEKDAMADWLGYYRDAAAQKAVTK